ncbi:MAG: LPXTG cell wall anchor domain-containing protein [Thermoleophilia bacterium]
MKAFSRTSMVLLAAVAILALSAGGALAAPHNTYFQDGMQINPETVATLQNMMDNGQLNPATDSGDEDFVVPPEEEPGDDEQVPPAEDDGIIPENPGNNGLDNGSDQPQDSGTPGNFDNPTTPTTPEQPPVTTETPKETPKVPETKLPNTGTQLVLLAGLGLTLAAVALGVRRFAVRRAR